MIKRHPSSRYERRLSEKKLTLDEKKLRKEVRPSKVRHKVIKESLKEQETQDELREYAN